MTLERKIYDTKDVVGDCQPKEDDARGFSLNYF